MTKYEPGDRVYHSEDGLGTIESIENGRLIVAPDVSICCRLHSYDPNSKKVNLAREMDTNR